MNTFTKVCFALMFIVGDSGVNTEGKVSYKD